VGRVPQTEPTFKAVKTGIGHQRGSQEADPDEKFGHEARETRHGLLRRWIVRKGKKNVENYGNPAVERVFRALAQDRPATTTLGVKETDLPFFQKKNLVPCTDKIRLSGTTCTYLTHGTTRVASTRSPSIHAAHRGAKGGGKRGAKAPRHGESVPRATVKKSASSEGRKKKARSRPGAKTQKREEEIDRCKKNTLSHGTWGQQEPAEITCYQRKGKAPRAQRSGGWGTEETKHGFKKNKE